MNDIALVVCCNLAMLLCCLLIKMCLHVYAQTRRRQRGKQLKSALQRLQELYAPLGVLLIECSRLAPAEGQLYPADPRFFSHLQKIGDLVEQKMHLFLEKKPPESFRFFLFYQQAWLKQQHSSKQLFLHIQSSQSTMAWPQIFTEDIIASYKALRRQHLLLLAETG